MSDDSLREIERRYQATGSLDDETALLRIQHQVGDLSLSQLRLAAFLGHTPARRLLGDDAPTAWSVLIRDGELAKTPEAKAVAFLDALVPHGESAVFRAAFAAAEAVVWEFRAELEPDAQDPRPADAGEGYDDAPDQVVEAVRAWLEESTDATQDGLRQAPECVSTRLWVDEHEILQDLYLQVFHAEHAVEGLRHAALARLADDADGALEHAKSVLRHAFHAVPSEKLPVGDTEDMGIGLSALLRDALLPWALGRRHGDDDESVEGGALGATSSDVDLVTKLQNLDATSPLLKALITDWQRRVITLGQPLTPGQRARALDFLNRS